MQNPARSKGCTLAARAVLGQSSDVGWRGHRRAIAAAIGPPYFVRGSASGSESTGDRSRDRAPLLRAGFCIRICIRVCIGIWIGRRSRFVFAAGDVRIIVLYF